MLRKTKLKSVDERNYWIFQLTFWAVLALPASVTFPFRSGPDFVWSMAIYGLLFAVSHIAHRIAQRNRWFYMAPAEMIVRLAIVMLILGCTDFAASYSEKLYQGGEVRRLFGNVSIVLAYGLGSLVQACAWTGCYMAFSEWRLRRGLEFDQLRLKIDHQEAQLETLKAQLNPHFLFNSLNTLRELIVEDPESAQQTITQLSAILRYSLQSYGKKIAAVSEEVSMIESYLAIEKIRYEDRLRVHWEIDKLAYGVHVPPLVLQTLVENAVKHGVSRHAEGGEVIIRAHVSDGHLYLEVLNTGEITASVGGVGLKNLRERLHLLYGAEAYFSLDSADGYVRASVILPEGARKEDAHESPISRR